MNSDSLSIESSEGVAFASDVAIDDFIRSRILTIRGVQVMLDRDLAMLYGVPAKRVNEQVKRNAERFPEDFMFRLTKEECLRSQIATLNTEQGKHLKYMPYAFTESGIAMLNRRPQPSVRKLDAEQGRPCRDQGIASPLGAVGRPPSRPPCHWGRGSQRLRFPCRAERLNKASRGHVPYGWKQKSINSDIS